MIKSELSPIRRTPHTFRRHLNNLRYKRGNAYAMFKFIKEEKKILKNQLFQLMEMKTGRKKDEKKMNEYFSLLEYLGVIIVNEFRAYDCEVEYKNDYSTEYIDNILRKPRMFDMLSYIQERDSQLFS